MAAATGAVRAALAGMPPWDGLLHVHSPHTTAGVTVNEQADPDVARDLEGELDRLVRWAGAFALAAGTSAAHAQPARGGTSAGVPGRGGRLELGTWQGIFLCEFDGPRKRELWLTPMKEAT